MTAPLGFEVEMRAGFDAALAATREALKAQGFGVITEIDLKATFQEKLGREFRRYTILGACNPPLAFAAMSADPAVGLLLPCNVTVEARDDDRTLVRLIDPKAMLASAPGGVSGALEAVAADARQRIEHVAKSLAGAMPSPSL